MTRAVGISIALMLSSCTIRAGYDDTAFLCSESEPCPAGQMCIDGVCSGGGGGDVDAALGEDAGGEGDANQPACQEPLALSDDFEDGETGEQWTVFADDGVEVIEDEGRLKITFSSSPLQRSGGYRSAEMLDITGARIFAEVPEMLDTATLRNARLAFGVDEMNGYFVEQASGMLAVGSLVEGARFDVTRPYDTLEHRWWQLREWQGQVIAEVSGDGTSWQELARFDTEGFATSALIEMRMRGLVMGGNDSVHFDNFNVGDDCP